MGKYEINRVRSRLKCGTEKEDEREGEIKKERDRERKREIQIDRERGGSLYRQLKIREFNTRYIGKSKYPHHYNNESKYSLFWLSKD